MDAEKFKSAQAAYETKDYRKAARLFMDSAEPGTPLSNGAAYHMAGNAFMRLKRYQDAITVYEHALKDDTYLRRCAVESNVANAYLKVGEFDAAIAHYQAALEEHDCSAPYKCYQGMGSALMEQHRFDQAAIAYRRAALDEANPDPGKNLVNLGLCLMSLGRPEDAIEAYTAALGTETYQNPGLALSNLGIAYFERKEWQRSARAFEEARTLHNYVLSDSAERMLSFAHGEMERTSQFPVTGRQDTSDFKAVEKIDLGEDIAVLAADLVGQPTNTFKQPEEVDTPAADSAAPLPDPALVETFEPCRSFTVQNQAPVAPQKSAQNETTTPAAEENSSDALGQESKNTLEVVSDSHMPLFGGEADVESFFNRSEKEAAKMGKAREKAERSGHRWVKVLVTIVVILALIGGAGYYCYISGWGTPTAGETVNAALDAYNTGKTFNEYWGETGNSVREMSAVPVPSTFQVQTFEPNGMRGVVKVKIKPESGSALVFKFNVARDGAGWKITSVENAF